MENTGLRESEASDLYRKGYTRGLEIGQKDAQMIRRTNGHQSVMDLARNHYGEAHQLYQERRGQFGENDPVAQTEKGVADGVRDAVREVGVSVE